jgi:hypothetical protein
VTQHLETAIGWLANAVASIYARRAVLFRRCFGGKVRAVTSVVPTTEDDDEAPEKPPGGKKAVAASASPRLEVMTKMAVAGAFVLFATVTFYSIEQEEGGMEWLFFDTFWFVFVSSTSIGLGDMSPSWARKYQTGFMTITMFFGLAVMAEATGALVELFEEEVVKSKNILEKVTGIDLDGDGKLGTKPSTPQPAA